ERWELFRARLERVLPIVTEVYQPPLFTRLGLRYKDLITRSAVNFKENAPWSELIRPEVLGPLATPELMAAEVRAFESGTTVALDQGALTLRISLMQHAQTREKGMVIDSDFYLEANREPDVSSALKVLDEFNRQSGGLFRWCITERLHKALDPR